MKKTYFSSSTLKIIAMICMFIDHFAAGIVSLCLNKEYLLGRPTSNMFFGLTLFNVYEIMRNIGRIAFPIFLFLLIEGFYKTRDRKKYFIRLLIFAFVSEIPFDLALRYKTVDIYSQNVYFELALILILLYFLDYYEKKFDRVKGILIKLVLVFAIGFVSEVIHADYGISGIVAAFVMQTFNGSRESKALSILPAFAFEMLMPVVFLSIPLVYFYNGKRGLNIKYLFYAFYPVHLLLIAILRISLL